MPEPEVVVTHAAAGTLSAVTFHIVSTPPGNWHATEAMTANFIKKRYTADEIMDAPNSEEPGLHGLIWNYLLAERE